ncbi:hypothetical protein MAR_023965, partial [Mya arenaria]
MGSCCCRRKSKDDSFEQLCKSSIASDNETISTVDDQHAQDNISTYGATATPKAGIAKKSSDKGKSSQKRNYEKPTLQSLEAEITMLRNRIKEEEVKILDLTAERAGFIHELDDLRTRLSSVISAQVTDSNPNIADLSDQNRPTKLAERYSELYDNQWTECYEGLTKNL